VNLDAGDPAGEIKKQTFAFPAVLSSWPAVKWREKVPSTN
jgi:hypothetical protein